MQSEVDERWRVREREVNEKMNEDSGKKDDMKRKSGKGGDIKDEREKVGSKDGRKTVKE